MAKEKNQHVKEQKQTTVAESVLFDEVAGIIRLMGETGLAELDLETSGIKVSLRRQAACSRIETTGSGSAGQAVAAFIPPQPLPVVAPASAAPQQIPVKPASTPATVDTTKHKIVSPMAGTFYQSPSPSAPYYVKIGDNVKVGQPVCIVEAMKLMNEIKADKAGKVVSILVENGKSVEKGTTLFQIDIGG